MDTNEVHSTSSERAKGWFWVLLDLFIVCAIINSIFVIGPAVRQFAGSAPVSRTVSVSGEGKAIAKPDIAMSAFSVVSQGADPGVLSDTNNKKVSAVVDFLKSQGLADADIQTTGYNLSPDYQYEPRTGRSSIVGYVFTQSVSVKIRDFKKISLVLAGLTPLGVNDISGIIFSVEFPEKFLAIARADAISKAKMKAEDMAAEAGAVLGRVVTVSDYEATPIRYSMDTLGKGGAAASPAPVAPTIEPGTSEITDQVTIVYELR